MIWIVGAYCGWPSRGQNRTAGWWGEGSHPLPLPGQGPGPTQMLSVTLPIDRCHHASWTSDTGWGSENLQVVMRSMICSICSYLLGISVSYNLAFNWYRFFFKQRRYVHKNITGCKQILHIKLLSAMSESLASHVRGKPLRSMIFQILISP